MTTEKAPVFQCSVFKHKRDSRPVFRAVEWPIIAKAMTEHKIRAEKDGPLWSPAIYGNGSARGNAGVEFLSAGCGDFDDGVGYDEVKERLAGYEYVAHSTFSHSPSDPHFRIIIPFSVPVPKADWPNIKARLDEHIFRLTNDQAVNDPARIYYMPSCPPGSVFFSEHHEGEWLDPYALPEATKPPSMPLPEHTELGAMKVQLGKGALDFVANGAPLGEQRIRALAAARNYLSAGYSVEDTTAAIWRGLQASPQDPDRGPWTYEDAAFIASDIESAEAPPLPNIEVLPPRSEIRRIGLGYQCTFPSAGITITIDRLRKASDGLKCEISIETTIPTVPRHLLWGSLNLSSTSARDTLERKLNKRTEGMGVDWAGILEDVCRKVAVSEREGEPFIKVGMLPDEVSSTWLIKDFLPKNEVTTLFGEGGSGKSTLGQALSLSVHTGTEVVPGYPPQEQWPVLYLDWETNHIRLNKRIRALTLGTGLPPTEIYYRRCTLPMADQVEDVLRFCQVHEIGLVVVDSVEMAMIGTRENGGDANDAILRLHSALRVLKTTVLLIDHVSKATGKETGKRNPYGGIFKTNLARMEYELRKAPDTHDDALHMALLNTKRNDDGFLFKPVGLRLVFEFGTARYTIDSIEDPDLIATLETGPAIKAALRNCDLTIKEIAEEINRPTNTVGTTMRRLEKAGTVAKVGKRNKEDLWHLVKRDE